MQAIHQTSEHSSERSIAICVDDFGWSEGINQAALELARRGRVHAISAMVGGARWSAGARQLRALHPGKVEVGLHLDLTECPLQASLRKPLRRLILDAYRHALDMPALQAEIRAQLDAFEQALGRAPAYVDGHQHVHQLPVIRTLLLDELARRYSPGNIWLRSTHSPLAAAHADPITDLKSRVIAALGAGTLGRLASDRGFAQNRQLLGVYGFRDSRERYHERLGRWLQCAQHGDLLMCHAGLPSSTSPAVDAIAQAREVEYSVLAGPGFDDLIAAADVSLQPLGHILRLHSWRVDERQPR